MKIVNEIDQTLLRGNAVWRAVEDQEALDIPEVSCGFLQAAWAPMSFPLPAPETDADLTALRRSLVEQAGMQADARQIPVWYHEALPQPGNHLIKVSFSVKAAGRVTLFANHRQMVLTRVYDAPCEDQAAFVLHMGGIIPRGRTEEHKHTTLDLCLMGNAAITAVEKQQSKAPTIFLMGDSTVTDQSADVPWSPLTSYSGWGQMLGAFIEGASVSNHAHSGLTTESFRSEKHWDVMSAEVRPGDWVLMQFGHNDQKLAHLQADTGYAENLRTYVRELRAMDAVPVLVTPLARNTWFGHGGYNDLLAAHTAAVMAVGKELNVPVIDLHGFAMDFIIRKGMEPARSYFYPGDWTHTNDHGAYLMASFVAWQLARLMEPKVTVRALPDWLPDESADRTVPPAVLKKAESEAWSTKNASSLPETIERMDAPITRAEAFEMVIRACNFFSINVYNDHYDDVTGHETWAGMIEAAVMNDLVPPEMIQERRLCPDQPARPYEMAAILIRGALARMGAWPAKAADECIPAWAAKAVGLLMAKELWQPAWNGKDSLTRGEALTMCRKLMG